MGDGEGEQVKLLGMWASPFGRRVELALKLKGVPYEYVEEDLPNKSPLLLNSNPVYKKVPVFLHNGKPISESLVILEYIDETWPNYPILPQDPYARATARFWAKTIDDKLAMAFWKSLVEKGKEQEEAREEVENVVKILENELKGKELFGGECIGYLDIVGLLIGYWFPVLEEVSGVEFLTQDKFPILFRWIAKLLDMEVVKECLPPRDEQLDKARTYFKS